MLLYCFPILQRWVFGPSYFDASIVDISKSSLFPCLHSPVRAPHAYVRYNQCTFSKGPTLWESRNSPPPRKGLTQIEEGCHPFACCIALLSSEPHQNGRVLLFHRCNRKVGTFLETTTMTCALLVQGTPDDHIPNTGVTYPASTCLRT